MRSCGVFVLNGFLLIFEVVDSLFENLLKIISYEGAAPLNTEEGHIPRAYPTVVNGFPHTPLGKFYCKKSIYQQIFGDSTKDTEQERLAGTCNEAQ